MYRIPAVPKESIPDLSFNLLKALMIKNPLTIDSPRVTIIITKKDKLEKRGVDGGVLVNCAMEAKIKTPCKIIVTMIETIATRIAYNRLLNIAGS